MSGRTKSNPVHNYFQYNQKDNVSICKLCTEQEVRVPGKVATNLTYHLKKVHPDEYGKLCHEEEQKKRKADEKKTVEKRQKLMSDYPGVITQKEVRFKTTSEQQQLYVMELVTKNGHKFSVVEDSGFKKITQPIYQELGLCMNRRKVPSIVESAYNKEVDDMKVLLKGRLLFLKADSASRHGRNFLGLNVQLACKGKLHVKTLAVREVFERNTGEFLADSMKNILESYDLKLEQVYAVTTDNGANFVKAVEELNVVGTGESEDEEAGESTEESLADESAVPEEISRTDWEASDTQADVSSPEYDDEDVYVPDITSVRCAAHTLQLAVNDFLKRTEISKLLATVRRLVKTLRLRGFRKQFADRKLRRLTLDMPTRWSSTFLMLEKLLSAETLVKELIIDDQLVGVTVPSAAWTKMKSLLDCLAPLAEFTTKMQREDFTAGELHELWIKCTIELKKLNSAMSKNLIAAMKNREVILDNKLISLSIYLDPRYKTIVLADKTKTIKMREMVLDLVKRLLLLRNPEVTVSDPTPEVASDIELDTLDEYEKYLLEKDKAARSAGSELQGSSTASVQKKDLIQSTQAKVSEELIAYEQEPRISKGGSVFTWWNDSDKHEALREVAQFALSLPVTQVSVERAFSGLKYIVSDARASLSDKSINEVLFLRLNKNFD